MALYDATSGLFSSSSKDKSPSALHTGRAWQTLARLHSLKTAGASLSEVTGKVSAVIAIAKSLEKGGLFFEDAASNAAATSSVVVGADFLARETGKKDLISDSQAIGFAEYFVSNRAAGSVHTAFHVITGMASLATGSHLRSPLVVTIVPLVGFNLDRPTEKVTVEVTDVLGRAADVTEVSIASVTRAGSTTPAVSDVRTTRKSAGIFEFDFLGAVKPAGPGRYNVVLSAPSPSSGAYVQVEKAERGVKVMGGSKLTEVYAAVSETGKIADALTTSTATFPAKIKEVVKAGAFHHLHMGFSVKSNSGASFNPHQVFARITNRESKKQNTFSFTSPNPGKFTLTIDLDSEAARFSRANGLYDVTVLVGDSLMSSSIQYEFASLDLAFNPTDVIEDDSEESFFALKKEIVHTFKEPAKRNTGIMAVVFTGVVSIVPLLAFLYMLAAAGFNLKGLPSSPTGKINALAFQGCIGAILVTLGLYWLGNFNLFGCLWILAPLSLVTAIAGRRALGDLSTKKRK